jgi:hypothetical protein
MALAVVLLASPRPATPSACCAAELRYWSAEGPVQAEVCAVVDARYESATPAMSCPAVPKSWEPEETDAALPPCSWVSPSPRKDTSGMNQLRPAVASPPSGLSVEPSMLSGAPGTPRPGATQPLARTASSVARRSRTICAESVMTGTPG